MKNISKFKFLNKFDKQSKDLLNNVVILICESYNVVLKNKLYIKSKMQNKRENQYRSDLVEVMNILKFKMGLSYLIVNSEVEEYNNGENIGLMDIKIQYGHLTRFDFNNEIYHTIECKRFGKDINLNNYWKNGVLDFLNGKYSRNTNFAAIICFIEGDYGVDYLVDRINNYLSKKNVGNLNPIFNENFQFIYQFDEFRFYNGEKISLTHVMLDYSTIYRDN